MHRFLPYLAAALATGFLVHADASAKPATATVPRLVGLRVHQAECRLNEKGFVAKLLGKESGEGVRIVTAQRPAAGATARVGSQVRVTYRWSTFGAPPPSNPRQSRKVKVPEVTGLHLREAVRRLERAGLGADAIGPTAGRYGRALVTAQHPAAGETVARRATIRVTWRYSR